MEAQDGGDPKNEVSPRDIVYTEPAEGGSPQVVAGTENRYQYVFSTRAIISYMIECPHMFLLCCITCSRAICRASRDEDFIL